VRAINLYLKIVDSEVYLKNSQVYEKVENTKILDFISLSLGSLKGEIENNLFKKYYYYHQNINETDVKQITDEINLQYSAFKSILFNMKFLPILQPHFTLKTMMDEISIPLRNKMRTSDIYFKIIPEFNFSETQMAPGYRSNVQEYLESKLGETPNVLSMTAIYQNNPLMWPLIFHEFGHSIFRAQRTKKKISDIVDAAKEYLTKNGMEMKQNRLESIISEIYSDIFAINYYRSNYLFAFYFHEILNSTSIDLINCGGKDRADSFDHPPSFFRLKYMIQELDKKGYSTNDVVLNKLLEIHKPFAEYLSHEKPTINPKYLVLFERIYEDVSKSFEGEKLEINFPLVEKLYQNLQEKLPIGTYYKMDLSLKEALKMKNEAFDIEENNKILEMVYAGWQYLLNDLIDSFFNESDPQKYLELSDYDSNLRPIENKLKKLNKEYIFLIKNISYSIEMSVITSNFRNDKKKKVKQPVGSI
jgi:hypothetical protein